MLGDVVLHDDVENGAVCADAKAHTTAVHVRTRYPPANANRGNQAHTTIE